MRTEDEIIQLFAASVAEVDNKKKLGALTRDTEIASLGLDSVMTMEVIGVMEEKLNVRFPDEELSTLKSLGDLATLVRKLG
jgi:acyl carrier protein